MKGRNALSAEERKAQSGRKGEGLKYASTVKKIESCLEDKKRWRGRETW